jgi:hypothetical protein
MNRYRIFMKKGPYEVGVGNNRFEAIAHAVKKGIPRSQMKAIALIKGNGKQRTFKVGRR